MLGVTKHMRRISANAVAFAITAASMMGSVWLGGHMAVLTALELWRGARSSSWPTTVAFIESAEVKYVRAFRPHYSPQITYSFAVDGRRYRGHTVAFRAMGYTREEATTVVATFPARTRAHIYYQPNNPAVSTLAVGSHWSGYFLVAVGAFFTAVPLVVLVNLLRNARRVKTLV